MRVTSFLGPDRPEQNPLTDADEVRECRRILINHDGKGNWTFRGSIEAIKRLRQSLPTWAEIEAAELTRIVIMPTAPGADPDWLSAEEFYAAADRELWGDAPFEED